MGPRCHNFRLILGSFYERLMLRSSCDTSFNQEEIRILTMFLIYTDVFGFPWPVGLWAGHVRPGRTVRQVFVQFFKTFHSLKKTSLPLDLSLSGFQFCSKIDKKFIWEFVSGIIALFFSFSGCNWSIVAMPQQVQGLFPAKKKQKTNSGSIHATLKNAENPD